MACLALSCSGGSGSGSGAPPQAVASASTGTPLPINTPIDSDGNGRTDLVLVEGDYNRNGVVSMQDLEDAARALTALSSESKEVRVVGTGVYGVADVPRPGALSRAGLIELDSNTLLSCTNQAVLEGWDETVPDADGHVVVNRGLSNGNRGITVRGCTIDGGQPASPWNRAVGARIGVYFDACDDCAIENSTLRNSFHACFYTRHGTDNRSLNNRYQNCGSHFRGAGTQGQPCLYVFARSGRTTRGVHSDGDVMLRCGAPAFNLRREDATATISDVRFTNAIVEDTLLPANPVYWGCFNLRGSESGNLVSNVSCRRTAGFDTGWAGGATGGYTHEATTRDAMLSGLDFQEMKQELVLGPWTTDVVLSGLTIASESTGIAIRPPNRGLVVAEAQICAARGGILFDTASGAPAGVDPADSAEVTTIRDVAITCSDGAPGDGVDYDGIEIRGAQSQRLILENVDVSGVAGDAVRVHDPARTGTPFELTIAGGRFQGVVRGEDDTAIRIHGGHFERVVAEGRATVTLFGSGFVATQQGSPLLTGYGDLATGFDGRITGVLSDGSALDVTATSGPSSRILLRAPGAQSAAARSATTPVAGATARAAAAAVPGLSGIGVGLLGAALAGTGMRRALRVAGRRSRRGRCAGRRNR